MMEKNENSTTIKTPEATRMEAVEGAGDPWQAESLNKDISKTIGGRLTNWFIDWGIGFFGNSGLSLYMTYHFNPHPKVKQFREKTLNAIGNAFKVREGGSIGMIGSGIRSCVEMCFQLLSGSIATLAMTPLVSRREKIAYGVNKMLGRDTDVLPSDNMTLPEPKTVEEKLIREVDTRVNHKQTWGDLWKARVISMAAIILGDQVYNWGNIRLEEAGHQSPDTLIFRSGQKIYETFPKASRATGEWLENHAAGMSDIRKNTPDHYKRLEAVETRYGNTTQETVNSNRIAVTEAGRILSKELGWTFVSADAVKNGTQYFHDTRVLKEKAKAIKTLKHQGLIPAGYEIGLTPDGRVIVSSTLCHTPLTANKKTAVEIPAQTKDPNAPSTTLDLKDAALLAGQLRPEAAAHAYSAGS